MNHKEDSTCRLRKKLLKVVQKEFQELLLLTISQLNFDGTILRVINIDGYGHLCDLFIIPEIRYKETNILRYSMRPTTCTKQSRIKKAE